jgi:hypothetical protein
MKVHIQATIVMATATFKKVKILSDQSAMHLFTMSLNDVSTLDAHEYFQLKHIEKFTKL